MNTLLAHLANKLPAFCIWFFPNAVIAEALHLLRMKTLETEAEIEALTAEINANDGHIAELNACLARLKAQLG